jgi:RNA polymerase sigma-70 factor (ECF subfamily)
MTVDSASCDDDVSIGTVTGQTPEAQRRDWEARPGEPRDWVAALTTPGADQTAAMRQLHRLMVRAAAHQVWRLRSALPDASPAAVDDIVNQAADEAMTSLLGKLHTFEGRSRFTTWAFKFAIVQAGTDVRRLQWQHRQVELGDLDVPATGVDGPEEQAEASDLARAVADAMRRRLTPYQRRIAVALLVEQVPIDVLADRLGTTRGALYKTVHDVRCRLRDELTVTGYLDAPPPPGGPAPHRSTPRPEAGTP